MFQRVLGLTAGIGFTIIVVGLITGLIPPPKHALADSSHIVSLYHDGQKKVITTNAATVGDALREAGVEVSPTDLIEPASNTVIPAGFFNINVYRSRPVVVEDGGKQKTVLTALQSPRLISEAAGLTVYPEDTYSTDTIENVTDMGVVGQSIKVNRATPVIIAADGATTTVRTQQKTVGALLDERDVALGPEDVVTTPREASITPNMVIKINRVKVVVIKETQAIAREITTVEDPNLNFGETKVKEEGSDGSKVATFRVEFNNGVEASRKLLSEAKVKDPVTKVVVKGTKKDDMWLKLRICESGNNYASKSNPNYRGAYQFSYGTWSAMGGSGDPANASPAEQDMRAQRLYQRSGSSQWPICGRYLH